MSEPSDRTLVAIARYEAAMHAVQSAIAHELSSGISRDTNQKHLRVGVNSALIDSGTMAALLVKKGIITDEEYFEALADRAEAEQRMYEERHAPLKFA